MNAIVLVGVMLCSLAEEDKLLVRLDADFESLVAADANRQQVREAARLLEETNQSGHQWQYRDALRILRRTRPKAAVPLLIKYMIRHSGRGSPQFAIAEYFDTLSLLTGKDVAAPDRHVRDRQAAVREGVQELADKWWTPHQAEITTDLDKMTPEQLEVVLDHLLKKADRDRYVEPRSGRAEVTAYRFYQLMTYRIMHRSSVEPAAWYPEELRPGMVRPILARAGFLKEPTAETHETAGGFLTRRSACWRICGRTAAPRSCRRLPTTLVRIRPRGLHVRWRFLASGEELKTRVLLSILEKEKDLESRLVAILALQYASEHATTGAKLVELLDDPNIEIQTAAICALRGPRPGAALPKLKKVVDKFDARQGYFFVLETLGAYRTREANAILVQLPAGRSGRQPQKPKSALRRSRPGGGDWSALEPGGRPPGRILREQARGRSMVGFGRQAPGSIAASNRAGLTMTRLFATRVSLDRSNSCRS